MDTTTGPQSLERRERHGRMNVAFLAASMALFGGYVHHDAGEAVESAPTWPEAESHGHDVGTGTHEKRLADQEAPTPSRAAQALPPPRHQKRRYGAIRVISNTIHGKVWVNGHRHGYPPILVERVPAGRTRVEIRVNGVLRRRRTIIVRPEGTQTVVFN